MRMAAFALLVSGWFIAVSALCLLPQPGFRGGFVVAGVLVECLGIFLLGRAHRELLGMRE